MVLYRVVEGSRKHKAFLRGLTLTVCRRQMFSRRDPIQPQKVRRNMRTPTTISRIAGSTARQAKAASGREADLSWSPVPTEGLPGMDEGCTQYVLPVLGGTSSQGKSVLEESWHVI